MDPEVYRRRFVALAPCSWNLSDLKDIDEIIAELFVICDKFSSKRGRSEEELKKYLESTVANVKEITRSKRYSDDRSYSLTIATRGKRSQCDRYQPYDKLAVHTRRQEESYSKVAKLPHPMEVY